MDAAIARNPSSDNLTLVIRTNAFTHKIDDGYLARPAVSGPYPMRRVGDLMKPAEVGAYIAANPATGIIVLRT